jgi:hypothetical protein
MHSYRVKEYMWIVIATLYIIIALTGCSSAPKVAGYKPNYCETDQTITVRDGERVSSETTNRCTTDQLKRLNAVRLGVADTCGYSNKSYELGGQLVTVKVGSCQVLDRNGNVVGYEYIR